MSEAFNKLETFVDNCNALQEEASPTGPRKEEKTAAKEDQMRKVPLKQLEMKLFQSLN